MPTPSFNICQDATATFAAYAWLVDKVDDGPAVAEAGVDEFVGSVWANGVDEALIQINEFCQGTRFADAIGIGSLVSAAHADADEVVAGATGTANCGMTVLSSTLGKYSFGDAGDNDVAGTWYDHSTNTISLRANAADQIQASSTAVTVVPATLSMTATTAGLCMGGIAAPVVRYATVSAAAATTTTLFSFTTANPGALFIEAHVCGATSDATDLGAYVRRALIYNNAGEAAIWGAVDATYTNEVTAGWDCTIDVTGNDVRVRVLGNGSVATTFRGTIFIRQAL